MDVVQVGVIVNTHGLKGTLKIKSITDFKEERYRKGNTLYILFKRDYIPVTVSSWKTVKGLEYLNFVEFTDINQCEKYKGSNLYITADMIHELPEDEFYFGDLYGMSVYSDVYIGIVEDVREQPNGELLVVKREKGPNVLIPFNKQFIQEVDKDHKKITIIEWEGLL